MSNSFSPGGVVVLVPLVFASIAAAGTINVPGDQPTIQACIDAAVSDVDECVVAPGTYFETINFNGKAIIVRSTNPLSAMVVAGTIIDGNGAGPVVSCTSAEGAGTVLDGLTISGGNAVDGGGMYNVVSRPTVRNCVFTGNTATNGGGMHNSLASPTVSNCTFRDNTAENGGGIYNFKSVARLSTCMFTGNVAGTDGGGLVNVSSNPTLTDCTFDGNTAATGGGVNNSGSNDGRFARFTNCVFRSNTAADGGGLSNYFHTEPPIHGCTFIGNSANRGGGIFNNHMCRPAMTDCLFLGNSASVFGGGMYTLQLCYPVLTNCVFSGNRCDGTGGALYSIESSVPTVTNCTFSQNTAAIGGGLYYEDIPPGVESPTVVNSILSGNTPDEIVLSLASLSVSYSDVAGGLAAGVTDDGGNIDAAPLFVDADGADNIAGTDDDDLRLSVGSPWPASPMVGSPCIDAGNSDALGLVGVTEDLAGDLRFADDPISVDTGIGTTPIVDMGAFELVPAGKTHRYLRFPPTPAVAGGGLQVLRVRIVQLDGFAIPALNVLYVGPPFAAPEEDTSQPGLTFTAARLQCEPYAHMWSAAGIVAAYGGEVVPNSRYDVQYASVDCPNFETDESCWSEPVTITTSIFGDIVAPFFPDVQFPDLRDLNKVVQKFLGNGGPIKAVVQVQPNVVFPDQPLSFKDLNAYVAAFLGMTYAEQSFASGPCVCPSSVTCGATPCTTSVACGGGVCIDGSCMDACGRCSP